MYVCEFVEASEIVVSKMADDGCSCKRTQKGLCISGVLLQVTDHWYLERLRVVDADRDSALRTGDFCIHNLTHWLSIVSGSESSPYNPTYANYPLQQASPRCICCAFEHKALQAKFGQTFPRFNVAAGAEWVRDGPLLQLQIYNIIHLAVSQ